MLIALCAVACKPVPPEQARQADKPAMGEMKDAPAEKAEMPDEQPVDEHAGHDHGPGEEHTSEPEEMPAGEAVEETPADAPDKARDEQPSREPADDPDNLKYVSSGKMGPNGLWISGERARDEKIVLETTKGRIVLQLHADWAPNGVAHFIELVKTGVYDGAPVFRCMHNFMVQFGVPADPDLAATWMERKIEPDAVKQSNRRGKVSYAMARFPDTRSTQIFINYVDRNSGLDQQGFAPFAEVIEGMEVADSFFEISDDQFRSKGLQQPMIGTKGGLERFKKAFPEADYILRAYILED